jgi:hypothetical protein
VTRAIEEIAIDKYALIRDGFLARRRNQIYDGDRPMSRRPRGRRRAAAREPDQPQMRYRQTDR